MENQTRTIVCPNCGANPTNHHNCEYCGSMLVRFVDKNLNLDINKYGKNAEVTIDGLEESIKSNLLMQKHPIENNIPITEIVSEDGEEGYQVLPTNEATFGIDKPNPYSGQIGLVLRIPFLVRSNNATVSEDAQARLRFFKKTDCYSLFDKVVVPEGEYYLLDCGEDHITASRILSDVISSSGSTTYQTNTTNVKKGDVVLDKGGAVTRKKNYYYILVIIGLIIYLILEFM